jgi:ArsR family transcriptional regulator, lead/cadmium/zinc/bismuth-responsive transcriptional repressor
VYFCIYTNTHLLGGSKIEIKSNQEQTSSASIVLVIQALNSINEKLETILDLNTKLLKTNEALLERAGKKDLLSEFRKEPDAMAILNLPIALRKTIIVLYKLEKATADDLALETKRLRAVESAAANELVRMGFIKKKREGREVYFFIENPEAKEYG